MEHLASKRYHRLMRKRRVRKKISGSSTRPRVTSYRSNRYLSIQAINDESSTTIASVTNVGNSTAKGDATKVTKGAKRARGNHANCTQAFQLGEQLGAALVKQKVTTAVFDCNGYRYHGTVKAIAEGIRKAGVNV